MSITASCVAIGVILVRLLLKKAPKIFSYILWAPVLFRLVCPFSFNSEFSFFNLINLNAKQGSGAYEFVPQNIGLMQMPAIQSSIGGLDGAVNASLPEAVPAASVNPMEIWMTVFSLIWVFCVIALFIYSIISYVKIKRKLQTATRVDGNVFETDAIGTAFVCGFIRPKIYVPANIGDANLSYILEHERTHIRRKDYLIKPLAFLALILHWFNPLMWLCFALMSRDMEMSCDESVLHRLGDSAKGGYSNSLLLLSVKRKGILAANPLAFGENHVKDRIKNVLNFKKPAFWVIVVAVAVVCAVGVAFATDKQNDKDLYLGYSIQALMNNKTPYVGNNSKVVGLIDAMPLPKGIARDTVELQTADMPYGITINYIMTDSANVEINGTISDNAFHRNAIVLFSLIDNADVINCKIADKTGKHDGATYAFTYTRETAEELVGKDLRSFAQNPDTIRSLIDIANEILLGENPNSAVYVSEDYKISLKYPSAWKLNSDYTERYEGKEGFFQVAAIDGKNMSIDEVAKNDAFHKLKPYGSEPKIINRIIDGQEARLILPSADQPEEMHNQAGLIVKYPEAIKIGGSEYHYFMLYADKAHIEQIGNTLTFLKKQIGAEKRSDTSTEGIAKLVEENLAIIMSSPKQASNPHAYIQAHQEEYENIKKLGGEKALQYMLSQFESGNAEGLRGHI
ncbi:MAG: M56 family metallopeptidase, partial [Petrimonas mucosa]